MSAGADGTQVEVVLMGPADFELIVDEHIVRDRFDDFVDRLEAEVPGALAEPDAGPAAGVRVVPQRRKTAVLFDGGRGGERTRGPILTVVEPEPSGTLAGELDGVGCEGTITEVRADVHRYGVCIVQVSVRCELAEDPERARAEVEALVDAFVTDEGVVGFVAGLDVAVARAGRKVKDERRWGRAVFGKELHRSNRRGVQYGHALTLFPDEQRGETLEHLAVSGTVDGVRDQNQRDGFLHIGWTRSVGAGLCEQGRLDAIDSLRDLMHDWRTLDQLNLLTSHRLQQALRKRGRLARSWMSRMLDWQGELEDIDEKQTSMRRVAVEGELFLAHRANRLYMEGPYTHAIYLQAAPGWRIPFMEDAYRGRIGQVNGVIDEERTLAEGAHERRLNLLLAAIAMLTVVSAMVDLLTLTYPGQARWPWLVGVLSVLIGYVLVAFGWYLVQRRRED